MFISLLYVFVTLPYISQDKGQSPNQARKAREATSDSNKDAAAYHCLLKNELFGAGIEDLKDHQASTSEDKSGLSSKETKNMFQVSELRTDHRVVYILVKQTYGKLQYEVNL